MGEIRNVIKSFDASNQVKEELTEIVETLYRLGEAKTELFWTQIEQSLRTSGSEENKKIPISSIVKHKTIVRAFTSSETDNIGQEVNNVLKFFAKGGAEDVINGITEIISGSLGAFLGTGSADEDHMEDYYVLREGISLVRVDMRAWYRSVTSKALTGKMEKVMGVVAVKSVVDMSILNFDTFIYFFSSQFGEITNKGLEQEIKEIKNIFGLFKKDRLSMGYTENENHREILIPPALKKINK